MQQLMQQTEQPSPPSPQALVWITQTTRAGDTNTRIGIAEHIGGVMRELPIPTDYCPTEAIPKRLQVQQLINADSPVWPDVVIGPCFHIPYMQEIKRLSGNQTVVVALRPPVRGLPIKAGAEDIAATDVIVSYPYHDNSGLPNVLLCDSISNRVTAEGLAQAKAQWHSQFAPMASDGPLITVMLGGDVGEQRKVFVPELAADLGRRLNMMAKNMQASLLISTSARTTRACRDAFCEALQVPYYLYDASDEQEENPYFGLLAWGDFLVVTSDSISMCCEAASSGKPLYLFYDDSIVESTHTKMTQHLVDSGFARLLNIQSELQHFTYKPVNNAAGVAAKVHECLVDRKLTAKSVKTALEGARP